MKTVYRMKDKEGHYLDEADNARLSIFQEGLSMMPTIHDSPMSIHYYYSRSSRNNRDKYRA